MAENKYAKDETIRLVNEIVASTGTTRSDLIPILQKVTNNLGYISQDAIQQISALLKIPTREIASVATFYRMLSTQPRGRHVVQFCESAPCHIVGGREVYAALKSALQLEPGQTSADNKWTFITTSCLGICGVGPVILIDTDIHGNVTPDQVPGILAKYA
ncbi:MAG: NADH-quinone oxidoreductase subunit NuoE [Chloroflexi bacterium]|jgi:NADH:ubiquinone oxidoreductase subunit E|nr:NADH-quinone oxidoreductase subunit NuoE [Anaerolineaceae bacterium]NLI45037.1 NADH-quinone oxidoreductase subunit NuoE [Chloroflexota bacterium]HOE34520.1 NADH-quinone oxidoreductase subunit NuoE [Anaerolineaceae bacterium]HOT25066.1 NADH-quinone oxidoreductase subunit NuoE [Anaerolineaceae bacterium]HQH57718.1 NADH-quinone oxidoreductase subunit NuoE [Anaerolineaceae bacterium]